MSKWERLAKHRKTVVEETPTGVLKLQETVTKGELHFFDIKVNDCVMKSRFDNVYGRRHSLNDDIMRATDVAIGRKRALVRRYCDVGKGCTFALCDSGVRVFIADCDPICPLQAYMEGLQAAAVESVLSRSTWLAWRP